MCFVTLDPGGEVRGCCVGCILGMPEIASVVFIAASYQLHGISRTKEMLSSSGGILGAAIFSGVLIGTKS